MFYNSLIRFSECAQLDVSVYTIMSHTGILNQNFHIFKSGFDFFRFSSYVFQIREFGQAKNILLIEHCPPKVFINLHIKIFSTKHRSFLIQVYKYIVFLKNCICYHILFLFCLGSLPVCTRHLWFSDDQNSPAHLAPS